MDGQRFDDLVRLLGASLNRKRFVTLVSGIFASAALTGSGDVAVAKKKGKHRKGRGDVGAQGNGQVCGGFCGKDVDCPDILGCVCDESENRCVSVICGGFCGKEGDCPDSPGCFCDQKSGLCQTQTCFGSCEDDEDCEQGGPECICDESEGQCVTITCTGFCSKDADCPGLPGCVCQIEQSLAEAGVEGVPPGTCVSAACAGSCVDNEECVPQGPDECVCFLGPEVDVASVAAEGASGECGVCRTLGDSCDASTECCGQLVCKENGLAEQNGGTCQRKPKPPRRCGKHGSSCHRDNDCCAQGLCYKGKCGEKDTHCNNNGECAQGYRCRGGPLAPGHRRCRKNGRRKRNKTQRRPG